MGHGHNQEHFHKCVILHNLMIEDESNYNLEPLFDVGSNVSHLRWRLSFEDYCQGNTQIENVATHYNLKNDLVEHLWAWKGNDENWNNEFGMLKNYSQHLSLGIIHMSNDSIPIIDKFIF
jgi:hypothetical protein